MTGQAFQQVVEIASHEGHGKSRSLSDLLKLHDALLEENENRQHENEIPMLNFRISPSKLENDDISLEADYCRAILSLSLHIKSRIQQAEDAFSEMCHARLERTIQQSSLLLDLLANLYSMGYANSGNLPSSYSEIVEWLTFEAERMEASSVSSDLMISLDQEALALEEGELLLMANTPIPSASSRQGTGNHNQDGWLVARVPASYVSSETTEMATVAVTLDTHRGVLRHYDDKDLSASNDGWWAAITASSESRYQSPTFSISNLVVHNPTSSSAYEVRMFEVQVGRNGRQWWEATSSVIQRLQEIETLQLQVSKL